MLLRNFPFYKQPDEMDCGPACLRMVAKYHGRSISLQQIRQLAGTTREGSSLHGLSEAAEKIGFRSIGARIPFEELQQNAPLPCIAHWEQSHFVVICRITKKKVLIADPGHGLLTYSTADFLRSWKSDADAGIVLLLESTPELNAGDDFEVLELSGSHAWGVAPGVKLVGYIDAAALEAMA